MGLNQDRRRFLKNCAMVGGFCSTLSLWHENLLAQDSTSNKKNMPKEMVDVKKYSYCGILCETECELFKATRENNNEIKKKVYEQWHMKEHFGFDFSPEKVFCYGCKPIDKPFKPGIKECPVRICAIDNGMESCIQCKNLASCDKEFWKKWKDLYKRTKELQIAYSIQPGATLLEIKN